MNIEIKKSIKPVNYDKAINLLEERVEQLVNNNRAKELIWFLQHPSIFTGGSSYKKEEILDKSIKIIKTSRGGKITWHGPGQLICYFVIDLSKNDGRADAFVSPNTFDKFSEYQFSVNNLEQFSGFVIKIVMISTNESYPVRLKDFRAIALA